MKSRSPIALALALTIALALSACSSDKEATESPGSTTASSLVDGASPSATGAEESTFITSAVPTGTAHGENPEAVSDPAAPGGEDAPAAPPADADPHSPIGSALTATWSEEQFNNYGITPDKREPFLHCLDARAGELSEAGIAELGQQGYVTSAEDIGAFARMSVDCSFEALD